MFIYINYCDINLCPLHGKSGNCRVLCMEAGFMVSIFEFLIAFVFLHEIYLTARILCIGVYGDYQSWIINFVFVCIDVIQFEWINSEENLWNKNTVWTELTFNQKFLCWPLNLGSLWLPFPGGQISSASRFEWTAPSWRTETRPW